MVSPLRSYRKAIDWLISLFIRPSIHLDKHPPIPHLPILRKINGLDMGDF